IKQTAAQKVLLRAKHKHHDEYSEALIAARNIIKEQATILHEKFGRHSVDYYFEEIMQCSQLTGQRKVTKWNTFVEKEVEHHNSLVPAGERQHKACELMPQICARWQEMDEDQRTAETEEVIESMKEHCEMRELSSHNVMLSALADATKTLEKVDCEARLILFLTTLHSRTGIEFILLAVRGDTEHWNQPHVFNTARAAEFFDSCLKTSLGTLAFCFEGYCVTGVQETAASPKQVQHMYYTNFDTNITAKYGVVLKNWPLSKFCCPGDINSHNELCVLFHAWETKSTRFCRLSDAEFKDWETSRFNAAMAQMSDNTNVDPPMNDAVPLPDSQSSDLAIEVNSSSMLMPTAVDQAPPPAPQCRKWLAAELTGVFSASGEGVVVQKKAHKERSDKGKKCSPRKGTRAATPTVGSTSSTLS
ncbi:hypothetical protein BDR05DRAFT_876288, partial [Suillus weaverae]